MDQNKRQAVALMRYSAIAPLIAGTQEDYESLRAYYRDVSAKGIKAPDGQIRSFREKDDSDGTLINGGFMVFEQGIFDYLKDDTTVLEQEPFRRLTADGEMAGYCHKGFWQCMDTQREKKRLEELWQSGKAPWKIW